MFGFGNSTPEPASQPGPMGMGMGNSREDKINTAYAVLSMQLCQEQGLNLQRCMERNGIRDDERAIQQKCGSEMQQLGGCMENSQEQVFGALSGIASQQCPSQSDELQSCLHSNSSNPQACERQYMSAMECAADRVIEILEQAQSQQAKW
eukprot:CAMPEP_0206194102 /NCGR_PEP_ID=MMETSP0166-20121206/6988_1 /ASSEMBLY_ACC=CAM_ASM_000260 /TAXON_ID=95228 /ORGANISM="Vannella robusta, Strain DIVA3 518/3/11/1/6" /LENGTH=149 /DNA_ID=CAMNT_0053610993 /DNA_START=43 /DNA_END=492 /DNA_ORIENTATION=-